MLDDFFSAAIRRTALRAAPAEIRAGRPSRAVKLQFDPIKIYNIDLPGAYS